MTEIETLAEQLAGEHYVCDEDGWHSCPLSLEGSSGTDACTCGRDKRRDAIRTHLQAVAEALTACQQVRDILDLRRRHLETVNSEIAEEAEQAAERAALDHQETRGAVAAWKQRCAKAEADLTACRAQGEAMRQVVIDWRENAIRSKANADNPSIPPLDRRQCFGVSQAYEQCADELAAALSSTPTEPNTGGESDRS